MAEFEEIDHARKILGLGEETTLAEIKEAYRKLALKYHPDKCKDEEKSKCQEMFKKVNNAHETLMAYCAGYKYSFREKDVKETSMDKEFYEHLKRFYDGWWGDLGL